MTLDVELVARIRRDIEQALEGVSFRARDGRVVETEHASVRFSTRAATEANRRELFAQVRPIVMETEEGEARQLALLSRMEGDDAADARAAHAELRLMHVPVPEASAALKGLMVTVVVRDGSALEVTRQAVTDARGLAIFGDIPSAGRCTVTEGRFAEGAAVALVYDVTAESRRADSFEAQGDALHLVNENEAAVAAYLRSLQVRERLLDVVDDDHLRQAFAWALGKVGRFYEKIHRLDEARDFVSRALALQEISTLAAPGDVTLRYALSSNFRMLIELEEHSGRHGAAAALREKARRLVAPNGVR